MIDVKELRIGNWVSDNGKNREVSGAFEKHIFLNVTGDSYRLPCYIIDPIPLTEEILLKCGFADYCFELYIGEIRFKSKKEKGELLIYIHNETVTGDLMAYIELPHIKSLHQLQNLLFALTGEELKVNI